MKKHYHVFSEMSGWYMPDEVCTFATLEDARRYAADELRRWRDDCATERECDDSQTGDPGTVEVVTPGCAWRIRYESDYRLDYSLVLDSCHEADCEVEE